MRSSTAVSYTHLQEDGKIHSIFHQKVTATGRLSSSDPNLQNIPIRMPLGRAIRKVFVPDSGYVFVSADYSQIELRVLAHMAGDTHLIEAYPVSYTHLKISAKRAAEESKVPIIDGSDFIIHDVDTAMKIADEIGYPVMLKASNGGGGRGMRIVQSQEEMEEAFEKSRNESKRVFGEAKLFIEKYLIHPKHIEVQILGDNYGNIEMCIRDRLYPP